VIFNMKRSMSLYLDVLVKCVHVKIGVFMCGKRFIILSDLGLVKENVKGGSVSGFGQLVGLILVS
jgi:hypothetical protein